MADVKKKVTKKTTKAPQKKVARTVILTPDAIGPFYEYNMAPAQAYCITHDTDGKTIKEAKGREQEYLVEFVNEQYGLMGTCIRVNMA